MALPNQKAVDAGPGVKACITCGGTVGPLSPEMARAKARLKLPLTPPKRCDKCTWSALCEMDVGDE